MPYTTVTQAITIPLSHAMDRAWIRDPQAGFVKKQILGRIAHAALIPMSVLTTATDIAIGTISGTATVLTGGLYLPAYTFAMRHLVTGSSIGARAYGHLLLTLNPTAEFSQAEGTDGLVSGYVLEILKETARTVHASDSMIERHVLSRALYLLQIPVSVITRVADGALGLIAAIFSILTLGNIDAVNSIAFRGFMAPVMVSDLFYTCVHVINPWPGWQNI